MALRTNHTPTEIATLYNLDLQKQLVQCHDISVLHEVKETPTLVMLEQAWGLEYVSRVIVKVHLIAVSEFCGVKNKMEEFQMDELCDQIVMEYGGLNVLEFICFCARLRSGKYETFYGNIDPTQITKSLEEFYEDRRLDINRAYEAREKARKAKEEAEAEAYRKKLRESFQARVPGADTPECLIDFCDWNWGGLHRLNDEDLKVALERVKELRTPKGGFLSNLFSAGKKRDANPLNRIHKVMEITKELLVARGEWKEPSESAS